MPENEVGGVAARDSIDIVHFEAARLIGYPVDSVFRRGNSPHHAFWVTLWVAVGEDEGEQTGWAFYETHRKVPDRSEGLRSGGPGPGVSVP